MPGQFHTPTRTSRRCATSETNAFGFDPDGRLTLIIQHLFGVWSPPIVHRPRFSGQYQTPPKYSPPTTAQFPWLPSGFVPKTPHQIYGSPRAPYLPPPLHYDAAVFSKLVSRPRRGRQFSGMRLVEEEGLVALISHGVWQFEVFYRSGGILYEFSIPTNLEWPLFERISRVYLGSTHAGGCVCYRIIRGGVSEDLRCLKNQRDWESMLRGIKVSAGEGRYEAIEIHDLDLYLGVSNTMITLETYYFLYPSVDDLLQRLKSVGPDGDVDFIDAPGRQGLRIAGMYSIDDFAMITPLELCLVSCVWPEKINVLFATAGDMILEFHREKCDDIKSIKALLQEYDSRVRST